MVLPVIWLLPKVTNSAFRPPASFYAAFIAALMSWYDPGTSSKATPSSVCACLLMVMVIVVSLGVAPRAVSVT